MTGSTCCFRWRPLRSSWRTLEPTNELTVVTAQIRGVLNSLEPHDHFFLRTNAPAMTRKLPTESALNERLPSVTIDPDTLTLRLHPRLKLPMNKKQKKQLEAAKIKHLRLIQLLTAAKQQPDDPQDIPRLQAEIAEIEAQMKQIREG